MSFKWIYPATGDEVEVTTVTPIIQNGEVTCYEVEFINPYPDGDAFLNAKVKENPEFSRVISRGVLASPTSETPITVRLCEQVVSGGEFHFSEYVVNSSGVRLHNGKPSSTAEWAIDRLLKSGQRRIEHQSVSSPQHFWIIEVI